MIRKHTEAQEGVLYTAAALILAALLLLGSGRSVIGYALHWTAMNNTQLIGGSL